MGRPVFQFLSEDDKRTIMNQVYRILEEIGTDCFSDKALEAFARGGCKVDGNRVRIPREILDKAIESAPSTIQIYDRNGKEAFLLGDGNSYFGPGPTCPNFMDARTGERRPSTKADAATTALVADALPNMDYVMSLVMIGDQTPGLADVHEIDAMVRNTTKPLCGWAFTPENVQCEIDMCAAVAGGLDKLQEKPFLMVYCEPTSPLFHTKEPIEILMVLAENNIPVVYSPGMIMGATAPVTMAGAVSVGLSESLAGLVLSQIIRPGAPFIGSANGGPMDMKTMQHSYGAPELVQEITLSMEMFHYIGIPLYGTAGPSDAKVVDGQCVAETTLQIITTLLAGGDLVHDIGFMDLAMTGSPLQMVVCDELIAYCKRYVEGVPVDEDHLGFDTIEEVGPGGNFLETDHTLDYYSDMWDPKFFTRASYVQWQQAGSKTMTEKAQDYLIHILDTHVPEPLPDEVLAQLDALVAKAENGYVTE